MTKIVRRSGLLRGSVADHIRAQGARRTSAEKNLLGLSTLSPTCGSLDRQEAKILRKCLDVEAFCSMARANFTGASVRQFVRRSWRCRNSCGRFDRRRLANVAHGIGVHASVHCGRIRKVEDLKETMDTPWVPRDLCSACAAQISIDRRRDHLLAVGYRRAAAITYHRDGRGADILSRRR